MVLTDKAACRNILGCLMKNTLLFLEYPGLTERDFDSRISVILFATIKRMYENGKTSITPYELDQEIQNWEACAEQYKNAKGIEQVMDCYDYSNLSDYEYCYNRVRKLTLLRRLKREHYDISAFYKDDYDTYREEEEAVKRLDKATIEDILTGVEGKFNKIRNEFLTGHAGSGLAADGVDELLLRLETSPAYGPSLEGDIFSMAARGAREGCYYLKSASTSAGKSRTSIFDACKMAYPVYYNWLENDALDEPPRLYYNRESLNGHKVLFIVTEMDKEELQTIILAYLSKVNEDHILKHDYALGERERVQVAAEIMNQYAGNFYIETISDPNLVNIEATIKRYATIEGIKYCWFDYIHTTGGIMSQFAGSGLREDVALMMLSNQLKQVAKDYKIFVFSATQVNASGMEDDGKFKTESSIRGSKAVADKADVGYVMVKINKDMKGDLYNQLKKKGVVMSQILEPTHVLDVYKMRQGRYKNVRIWIHLDLGTGFRRDLYMTTADDEPIDYVRETTNFPILLEGDWKEAIRKCQMDM